MFVYRPELLLLTASGEAPHFVTVAVAVAVWVLGIIPLAAGMAGYLWTPLSAATRAGLFLASGLLLTPVQQDWTGGLRLSILDVAGALVLGAIVFVQWRKNRKVAEIA
jgi:TRAP-type uncharacterized transport system fused permease subunit